MEPIRVSAREGMSFRSAVYAAALTIICPSCGAVPGHACKRMNRSSGEVVECKTHERRLSLAVARCLGVPSPAPTATPSE